MTRIEDKNPLMIDGQPFLFAHVKSLQPCPESTIPYLPGLQDLKKCRHLQQPLMKSSNLCIMP